jgi:hypothetical protein
MLSHTDKVQNPNPGDLSWITMPIPDQIKPHIAENKINAYSLSITAGACDPGVVAQSVSLNMVSLDLAGGKLVNEKLVPGCAYTLALSLGHADAARTMMQKTYLTNDQDGKRTEISIEQSRASKIKVTAVLYVTEDGKKDLKLDSEQVPVPSVDTSDVDIAVDIDAPGDFNWRKSIQLIDIANVGWSGNDNGSAFYRDIMSHSQRKLENESATTNAHETQHFLNNAAREKTLGVHDNVIYVGDGKAAMIMEPSMKPNVVRNYVPEAMKKVSRFQQYMIKQIDNSWKDEVLYIFDEWSGYRADLRVAVEMIRAGKSSAIGNEICIGDGAAEFLHFGSSAVAALKDKEPEYLKNSQFKAAYAILAEDTVTYVRALSGDKRLDCNANADLQYFIISPEAEHNRQVIREWMGPVWTRRVLGF